MTNNITLPEDGSELLRGRLDAQKIAESCSISFWMHSINHGTALYHLIAIHAAFENLADALGYDISKREPVKAEE
jgi:hypothetical protein